MEGRYGGPFRGRGVEGLWLVGGLLELSGLIGVDAVVARVDLGSQRVVRGVAAVVSFWAGIDRLGGWLGTVRADAALGNGGVLACRIGSVEVTGLGVGLVGN